MPERPPTPDEIARLTAILASVIENNPDKHPHVLLDNEGKAQVTVDAEGQVFVVAKVTLKNAPDDQPQTAIVKFWLPPHAYDLLDLDRPLADGDFETITLLPRQPEGWSPPTVST